MYQMSLCIDQNPLWTWPMRQLMIFSPASVPVSEILPIHLSKDGLLQQISLLNEPLARTLSSFVVQGKQVQRRLFLPFAKVVVVLRSIYESSDRVELLHTVDPEPGAGNVRSRINLAKLLFDGCPAEQ